MKVCFYMKKERENKMGSRIQKIKWEVEWVLEFMHSEDIQIQ